MPGRDLDKKMSRDRIAYVDSLSKSGPGQFVSWASNARKQSLSMKNEGPSRDVIENT
jgi:hypothetical protein